MKGWVNKLWSGVFAIGALWTPACAFDATIPVLDMNDYLNPESHERFIGELYSALKEVGFFAVVNTGVDTAILDEAYRKTEEFFNLSREQKMGLFDPSANGQRGYVPGESPKGSAAGDFKEFLHVGRELHSRAARAAWVLEKHLAQRI